jgi:hypothetical protein
MGSYRECLRLETVDRMSGTVKFAVFHLGLEYHTTKETPLLYHSGASGEVRGVSLNTLCGAHIDLVPKNAGNSASADDLPNLYDEPPAGLRLCKGCERVMTKRKGWIRLLAHLFHRKGLRTASRSLSCYI